MKEINRVLRQKERGEFTLHVMDTKVLAEEKIFKKRSKVLIELSQTEKHKYHMILLACGFLQMNQFTKQKWSPRCSIKSYGY